MPKAPVTKARKRAPKLAQINRSIAAVLDATAELLAEVGYRPLTIELISTRSGVARSTIYRQWNNVAELAIDAFDHALGPNPPPPDTGNLRDDLIVLYKRFAKILRRPIWRTIMPSLIEASQTDARFGGLLNSIVNTRRESERTLFTRAIVRGEIRSDSKMEWALDALTGAYYHRLLMTGANLREDGMAEWLVDSVLSQLRKPPKK
ncbi:MAG: TetR/AcrR family transcriptional regulator [Rhizomicrobium sp.]